MRIKTRARPVAEISLLGLSGARAARRKRRPWPWALGILGALVVALLGLGFFAWPSAALSLDSAALARLSEPRFGGAGVLVSVRSSDGTPIPATVGKDGRVWPDRPIAPGTRMLVQVVFRRPVWIGWLAGRAQRLTLQLTAPRPRLEHRWLRLRQEAPLRLRFDVPVRRLELAGAGEPHTLVLRRPSRSVVVARRAAAGSLAIRAVAESWEQMPPAQSLTWFPPGRAPRLLVSPRPNSRLNPGAPLTLRFSAPADRLLHGQLPAFERPVSGRWQRLDPHTLIFRPRGYGYGLQTPLWLRLPAAVVPIGVRGGPTKSIVWGTPPVSQLRLQQLLAKLGYLPLQWAPGSGDAAPTVAEQMAAALHPPRGRFSWRYPNIPAELRALWTPGQTNSITRGAVMMLEERHGLDADGFAGAQVWRALITDTIAGRRLTGGYSYVYVHLRLPQSLNLWHDGHVILSSPGNTGVPAAPTQRGTFPVFEHISVGTMSGTNPDGSHYSDPGIRYISYFNGGDAIHAFNRASFGTPQSLGCVELPLAAAAKVWPYTPIGTLVTVEN